MKPKGKGITQVPNLYEGTKVHKYDHTSSADVPVNFGSLKDVKEWYFAVKNHDENEDISVRIEFSTDEDSMDLSYTNFMYVAIGIVGLIIISWILLICLKY